MTLHNKDITCSIKIMFDGYTELWGSCNGLVLLVTDRVGMSVFNPTTLQRVYIPDSPLALDKNEFGTIYGFGYDSSSDDYKIVILSSYKDEMYEIVKFVDVYSLKRGVWNRVISSPYGHAYYDLLPGAFVNNAIHWLNASEESGVAIAAFDLANEVFYDVCGPTDARKEVFEAFDLVVLEGCLCMFTRFRATNVFWMLNEYGSVESWTKFKKTCEHMDTDESEFDTGGTFVESLVSPFLIASNDRINSEDEWPVIKHDDFTKEYDIPVISLSEILQKPEDDEMYKNVCRIMVAAAHKWGFFKLVDHGVASEIVDDIKICLNEFFNLSMEKKMNGSRNGSLPLGYSASNLDYERNLPWAEILQLLQSPQQVVEFSKRVYGDDHHLSLSNAIIKYMKAQEELGRIILKMLAHGLGLTSDFFTRNLTEKEAVMIRVNRYPPCPLPEKCLGLGSHSDPHTLTILLQDEIGGLQVLKDDDQWFGIRPVPNSFIVNIGDTLEAWTNGRLKSVVHRAVLNKESHRLSIAYFISPASTTVIESPPELVDSEPNPRKYASFTWGEFRKELLMQKRVVGKTALDRYLMYR
ncbi:hypothetical protein RD792_009181 [Penstemon davidsonii]|uniref:Fe2OG dioxygenase domain-containing protein n=1 Tax=Penstemon davidsonii TaxID=160366 RepID=A0ABR0DB88_9LAMI|nr:hypothetical protein RD792_009181 [Penstemon davidsonii]